MKREENSPPPNWSPRGDFILCGGFILLGGYWLLSTDVQEGLGIEVDSFWGRGLGALRVQGVRPDEV